MTLEERFAVENIEAELTRLRSENTQLREIIEGMGGIISGAREEIAKLTAENERLLKELVKDR